jgi:CheY-like chemotaxis protein
MDVIMPKMTGFEAVRELRLREETKTTPIIMVTTRGEGSERRDRLPERVQRDYLTKPIDAVALLAKIHDYLGE